MTQPEPLPDIWYSRDLPLLRDVAHRLQQDPDGAFNALDVAQTLRLTFEVAARSAKRLKDDGYLDGHESAEHGVIGFTRLTAKGLREVGQWPSPESAADRRMAALEQAIERAPEGSQKTRLQKIRDGFLNAGRDLAVDVAGQVLTRQIGTA